MVQLAKATHRSDKAMTSLAATAKRTEQLHLQNVITLMKVLRATKAIQQNAEATGTKLSDPVKKATKSNTDFLVSWKSILRLTVVQVAHVAISGLQKALSESISTATTLKIRVAELLTLTEDTNTGFDDYVGGLRAISDAFGLDIVDQASAAYETLSNQIADGTEAMLFLNTANKLAVSTVSSAEDAVNLLSSAINAFHLPVSQAESIAAKFFKTVDLGRVTTAELASDFGRIAVPASLLGISLDDLTATIALFTNQGIKSAESATLIRNVFLKLIDPTDEMKQLFRDLGVESGQQLLSMYSVAEVFGIIEKRVAGSANELDKLFSRIRATTGAMILVNGNLETFQENVRKITDSTKEFEAAQQIILENSGKKLEIELNKIKNFFTIRAGSSIVDTLIYISENIINLTTAVKLFAGFMAVILPAAIAAATVALGSLALAASVLTAPVTLGVAAMSALALAIIAVTTQQLRYNIAVQESVRQTKLADAQAFARRQTLLDDQVSKLNIELDLYVRRFSQFNSKVDGEINQLFDKMLAKSKAFQYNLRAAGREVRESIQQSLTETRQQIDNVERIIEANKKASSVDALGLESKVFDLQVRDERPKQLIESLQARLTTLNRRALDAAKAGNTQLFALIRNEISQVQDKYIDVETELQKHNKARREAIDLEAELQKQVEQAAEQRSILNEKLLESQKKLQQERSKQLALSEELRNIVRTTVDYSQNASDALENKDQNAYTEAVDKQIAGLKRLLEIQVEVTGEEIKNKKEINDRIVDLEATKILRINQLRRASKTKEIEEQQEILNAALAATKTRVEAATEAQKAVVAAGANLFGGLAIKSGGSLIKNATPIYDQLARDSFNFENANNSLGYARNNRQVRNSSAFNQYIANAPTEDKTLRELGATKAEAGGDLDKVLEVVPQGYIDKLKEALEITRQFNGRLRSGKRLSVEQLASAKQAGAFLATVEFKDKYDNLNQGVKRYNDLLVKNEQLVSDSIIAGNEAKELEILQQRLARVNEATGATKKAAEEEKNKVKSLEEQFKIIERINVLLKERSDIANELKDKAGIPSAATPPTNNPNRFARGGTVPGAGNGDTVPAMLTPGEFVVNRDSSNLFRPLLLAMNNPIDRNKLGRSSSANNNFEVNINISNGANLDGAQLARQVQSAIESGAVTWNA